MKDAVGLSLREAWKAKGNPDCEHQELSPERSFSGTMTGAYICTTCGALIDETQASDGPRISRSGF